MRLSPAALLTAVLAVGCVVPDPVQEARVAALGPERPGVPVGPLHRPGQPCGVCHRADGPARPDFAMAGTVFAADAGLEGARGIRIELVDSLGSSPPSDAPVVTNEAGNFFVPRSDWSPRFPVRVRIVDGDASVEMRGVIGGTASCAECHASPGTVPVPGQETGPVRAPGPPDGGAP